jgi:hypothetical protein
VPLGGDCVCGGGGDGSGDGGMGGGGGWGGRERVLAFKLSGGKVWGCHREEGW